ncbi:TetR/AcrR family transcriptional regulator [Treponema primitia]|uniref:TetR/AcrR family transcriptional regulator n=1 Tax=Treponema primitia TaxID=88058 RepID=UPI00025552B5|nr:TetR/AcrR family transcriptional regulator [Treponema primitia]
MDPNAKGLKGEKSKVQLIECAAHLFLENGYNATGINEIITKAGLSKGSFYFYFSSKKELAISVTEYHSQMILTKFSKIAQGKTWEDFVEKLVGVIIKKAKQGGVYGCPLAVLGMETAFLDPDIAVKNHATLKSVADIFEDVLKRSGFSKANAVIAAERALAIFEGHLLLYRLGKDGNELKKIIRDLKDL